MNEQQTVWALMLKLYEANGVQPVCLQLQDQYGVGVSALLSVMILGYLGEPPLSQVTTEQTLKRAAHWQQTVIEPLRAVRRRLREVTPADQAEAAESLRKSLLSQEIAAEKIQQALICCDLPPSRSRIEIRAQCLANASSNASMYFSYIGQNDANKKAAEPLLQRLIEALARL